MKPLDPSHRNELLECRRIIVAHEHRQPLDIPDLIRWPNDPLPEMPTIHESLYSYQYAGLAGLYIVEKGFLYHRGDYGLGGHRGDSEAFVIVWPFPLLSDSLPVCVLTREHTWWHVYEAPPLIDGMLYLHVEAGKHPITVLGSRSRLVENDGDYRVYGSESWPLRILDIEGPAFDRYLGIYQNIYRTLGIDWPWEMADLRMENSHWPDLRGNSIGKPWNDPLWFFEQAPRCGIHVEQT